MKIIGTMALHYGSPYLMYSIQSVINAVDELYIMYSPNGSHGTRAHHPLPPEEKESNLRAIAELAAGNKLRWIRGEWLHEGAQRDTVHELAPDADVIVTCDYDEIYWPMAVFSGIEQALAGTARIWRFPMIHYWRSFHRAIVDDYSYPERIVIPSRKERTFGEINTPMPINHMGYCIPSDLLAYKLHIHGHKNEMRTDIDWYKERWQANAQADVHWTSPNKWTPVPVDPHKRMPQFMRHHPYMREEIVE